MPRVALTVQAMDKDGLLATYSAPTASAGNGSTIAHDSNKRTYLHVKNDGGVNPVIVSLLVPKTDDGLDIPDRTVSVALGTDQFIPMRENYKQTDNLDYVEYDQVTSVTVAAIIMPSV